MTTSTIQISLQSPSKRQLVSPNSPVRRIHPTPEKTTDWTVAIVSPNHVSPNHVSPNHVAPNFISPKHFINGDPARKLLFNSDDAANRRETERIPTPLGAPKEASDVLPAGHSTAEEESSTSGSAQLARAAHSRHIIFPHGSMKLPDGGYRGITDEEKSIIHALYPRAYRFTFSAPISVLVFHELPPKPWPLSIGGMPVFFTTDPKKQPYPHGFYGLTGRALQDHAIKLWTTPSDEQMRSIFKYFYTELHIHIRSVIWLGCRFHVIVPLGTCREDVPGAVLGLLCSYSFPDPIPREETALRNLQPANLLRDDSNYSPILRPGVMLSCGDGAGQELLTSSGVPVKKGGEQFVTVASHGFAVGEEVVWHPNASGDIVGEVKKTLGETDISLMELRPGCVYSTEVFNASQTPTVILQQFRHHSSVNFADPVYMDSPFSGPVDGMVVSVEHGLPDNYVLPPTIQLPDNDVFVKIIWLHIGSGHADHLQGTCGSAVWDDNGDVVGFFRFVDENGNAFVTSPAPLIEHGWEIAAIP